MDDSIKSTDESTTFTDDLTNSTDFTVKFTDITNDYWLHWCLYLIYFRFYWFINSVPVSIDSTGKYTDSPDSS